MRIVFLDFDGVLIQQNGATISRKPALSCVSALNAITEKTGARIVVSSSWRHVGTLDKLRAMLRAWGVKAPVVGVTPAIHGRDVTRAQEIAAWLKAHRDGVECFAILDDDPEMKPLAAHHIQTEKRRGLTGDDADRAVSLLTLSVALRA
jgi:hypothetical protein